MRHKINYLAVLACAVFNMLLGAAWYGVFGATWMRLNGLSEAQTMAGGTKQYIMASITSIAVPMFAAWLWPRLGVRTLLDGARYGLAFGIIFTFLPGLTTYGFSMRPAQLGLIDFLYPAASLMVMGGIIGAWKVSPAKSPLATRA